MNTPFCCLKMWQQKQLKTRNSDRKQVNFYSRGWELPMCFSSNSQSFPALPPEDPQLWWLILAKISPDRLLFTRDIVSTSQQEQLLMEAISSAKKSTKFCHKNQGNNFSINMPFPTTSISNLSWTSINSCCSMM